MTTSASSPGVNEPPPSEEAGQARWTSARETTAPIPSIKSPTRELTMTDTLATLDPSATNAATEPDGFRRIAAIAGIITCLAGLASFALLGSVPVLGDSQADVAAYFAHDASPHRMAVVFAALLGIPIAIFLTGVHRSLASAQGRSVTGWTTVFLYGVIMMSATVGLKEALYAIAVHYADSQPDPAVLRLLSDGSQIVGATLGAWMALAVGSVAVVALRGATTRWYSWLTGVVAIAAVVSVVDTVNTSTAGALASLAFVGFVVWMLASSIVMMRRPLLR